MTVATARAVHLHAGAVVAPNAEMRHLMYLLVVLAACADRAGEITSNVDTCALADVPTPCSAPAQAITASAARSTATPIDAGVTYAIAGPAPGTIGYVVFTPATTGTHTLYFGDARPLRVCDLSAACESTVTRCGALHRAAQYEMVGGERYEIELSPVGGHPFMLHVVAPAAMPDEVRLTQATTFAAGTTPYYVETADLDGDGALDLVVSTPDDAGGLTTVDILAGTGTGAFTMVRQIATSAPGETVISDFSGDGIADIAGIAWDGQGPLPDFYLQGQGSLSYTRTTWGNGRDFRPALAGGDFDEDGVVDLVAAYADTVNFPPTGAGFVIIAMPSFTVVQDEPAFGSDTRQAIAGDFDGDGHQDVVAASSASGAIRLYRGSGTGTVAFDQEVALPDGGIGFIAAFDLDADGRSDLVAAHFDGTATVSYATPSGFSAPIVLAGIGSNARVAAGDFDHDGRLDLAFAPVTSSDAALQIFLATATGFELAGTRAAPNGSRDLVVADFDGDGFDDIAATTLGAVAIYRSTP